MTRRLAGPRVALLPVPGDLAAAVVEGDERRRDALLLERGLRAAAGWPHAGSATALHAAAASDSAAGAWLVVHDGEVVGECGSKGPPDADGAVEIGYGLAAGARSRGLGTEAVAVLCAALDAEPDVRLLTAQVLPGNEASLRLLLRLGFREHGSRPPHLRLVRPAPGQPPPELRGRAIC